VITHGAPVGDGIGSGIKGCRIPYRNLLLVILRLNKTDSEEERKYEKSEKENPVDRSHYCAANRRRYVD
jgi:hypothetical protein